MPRSADFRQAAMALRMSAFADARGMPTKDVIELAKRQRASRRDFMLAAGVVLGSPFLAGLAAPPRRNGTVAIVGAGIAGLACADRLRAAGVAANLYEAAARVGGRCHSVRGTFAAQTAEYGGEFIDTTHQTMRQYAVQFGLAREDVVHGPHDGETRYHFGGQLVDEATIVDEYRVLVPRIRADMQTLSAEPTFRSHTAADVALDSMSLAEWLALRCADLPLVRAALEQAYVAEYGLETSEQSALNLLLFLHADRRRRFQPFGVFSDERFHLIGGNDAIATRIAARLPGEIALNRRLQRLSRLPNGRYRLEFAAGPNVQADHVVLTLPFSVLRGIELDASLGIGADKRRAIDQLGYGKNAKTMIQFGGRPWEAVGCSGAIYTDLPNVQTTWETNPALGGVTSILTDYAGGTRGGTLGATPIGAAVDTFLGDLDAVVPNASTQAIRDGGVVRAARAVWTDNANALGSYTCYRPGQFTGIGGLEGEAVGRLKFAGEHADSFFSWQGFMEGACLSGIRAANGVLASMSEEP
jgi:monoamine oxidase